jgi:hypothetical protein
MPGWLTYDAHLTSIDLPAQPGKKAEMEDIAPPDHRSAENNVWSVGVTPGINAQHACEVRLRGYAFGSTPAGYITVGFYACTGVYPGTAGSTMHVYLTLFYGAPCCTAGPDSC